MRRIFLIDCPGVVYDSGDSEVETVLKGVVRAERLPEPTDIIPAILQRVKHEYLTKVYGVETWTNEWDFLEQLARKQGKLLPKGEPDFNNVAIQLINDYQRGKLPWFVPPPSQTTTDVDNDHDHENDNENQNQNQNQDPNPDPNPEPNPNSNENQNSNPDDDEHVLVK